ncbi:hypothetical protein BDF14DRAFT_1811067 [Spinellus fusiger]|nr:hypothetical protein BDF14DRAFT_1811067 [Spinellus fusiger]
MLFTKLNSSTVSSFKLSVSSGHDQQVAFGPGSVVNGSITLTLDKPLWAYNIRVSFRCEESNKNKTKSTLFSVDEYVWGKARADQKRSELPKGSSVYLFAICLPHTNYPSSMRDTRIKHSINYALQGHLEYHLESPYGIDTLPVSIFYLPLVKGALNPNGCRSSEPEKGCQVFTKGDTRIKMEGELIKTSYCPGDVCTIKLTITNASEHKITTIQVTFNSTATPLPDPPLWTEDAPIIGGIKEKHQSICTETFPVSIAKQSQGQAILQFHIPSHCVPSSQNHMGRYSEFSYTVTVTLPITSSPWTLPFTGHHHANTVPTLTLPVLVATIPDAYTTPTLVIPSMTKDTSDLPHFIRKEESPLPSPGSGHSSCWGSSSPVDPDHWGLKEETGEIAPTDTTGHLMVPSLDMDLLHRRRSSISSIPSEHDQDNMADICVVVQ